MFSVNNKNTRMTSMTSEITFRHGCSPLNLLRIFRIPFSKNTSGRLLLSTDLRIRYKREIHMTFDVLWPFLSESMIHFLPLFISFLQKS